MNSITCSGIILLVFTSLGMCQDQILLSNLNLNETFNSSVENNTIPERLLIRMKDVKNVSQLLRQFTVYEMETNKIQQSSPNGTARRPLTGASGVRVAQPANCQTEQQVIELDKPENPAILYWPSCIRVRRCGGCCTSSMLVCKPLATSNLNVTVLQLLYNHENPNSFESQGTQIFSIEQHDRCACSCKEVAEDCDLDIHDYRPSECRCVCKNAFSEQAVACTGPKKVWDSRECVCKCRNVRMCSSGRYFNVLTCRCQRTRKRMY